MGVRFGRWSAVSKAAALAVTLTMVGLSLTVVAAAPAGAQTLNPPDITSPVGGATEATPTVTVGGTADPSTDVVVIDGTTWVAEATSDTSGNWSVPVTLLAGAHSLTALEVDSAGDESAASSAVPVNVSSDQVVADGDFGAGGPADNGDHSYLPDDGTFPAAGTPGYWFPTNGCPGSTTGYIEWNNYSNPYLGPMPEYQGDGNFVELNSNCVNGVTQTLPTVPGDQYTLTFGYGSRPNFASCSMNDTEVQWGASTVASDLCGPDGAWQTADYTLTATSTTTALSFVDQDTDLTDTEGGELAGVSVVPTSSLAPSNTSWDTAEPVALSGDPGSGSPTAQSLDFSGEALWYQIPVVADEQVSVQLTGASAGEQFALYSDIGQAYAAETSGASASSLPVIEAQDPGNNASKFNEQPLDGQKFNEQPLDGQKFNEQPLGGQKFNEQPYLGAKFNEQPYVSAESDSLLGESSPAGAATQSITADTYNDIGNDSTSANYYVEVFGDNGAFAAGDPFDLTVNVSGSSCSANLSNYSADGYATTTGGTVNGAGTDYQTVIVEDSATMPGVTGISSTLQSLAQATDGVVVDVGQSQWVKDLTRQVAANPACPYAGDLEADAIQSIVNTYRQPGAGPSNLKYVVIVGDDDVIPFFRYGDAEVVGPEDAYQVPLTTTTPAAAALGSNYYLSDDQYGATTELSIDGTTVPVQSAAVGRLVETPAEIATTIDNYLASPTITPKSTLSTGYSFMAPAATQIAGAFSAGNPSGTNTQLNSDTWSAADLSTDLTDAAHQLVFLGAHFNANGAEAADGSALWSYQFADEIGSDLQSSLVLSAGCHSGYTIDPADAVTGVTGLPSWPEAFATAGATLIAGTGYQFGDSNYVADSDQFYVDLADQLGYQPAAGPGPVPVGTALLDTEYQYLAGLDRLNGLNEKSLLEVTLYGLPMLGIQEPHQVVAPPAATSIVPGVSAVANGPGSQLGLEEANVDIPTGTLTPETVGSLTYDQGPQGVVSDPGEAVVPVQTEDVNVAGETLRGVGFWGGAYTDTSGTTPLTGDPVTDTTAPATPFSSATYYPQKVWNPNYFGTIDTGADTQLGITPVQYVSDPQNPSTAIMRTYSDTDFNLFYSNDTSDAAQAAAPEISDVSVTNNGGQVTVSASVVGDLSADIQEVWVTYTDPTASAPSWKSVDLTSSDSDPDVYSATFTDTDANLAADGVFMVQAANGVGEVSLDDNEGSYFTASAATPTAPVNPNTYALSLGSTSGGAYQSTLPVSADLTDLAGTGSLSGRTVTFQLGSRTVTAETDSNGDATASLPLTAAPGSYQLTADYAGDALDSPATASEGVTISPAQTALALSAPAQLTSGGSVSATLTSAGSGVLLRTVYFDVTAPGGAVVAAGTGTTNSGGVAVSGPLALPAGDVGSGYAVTAYFGSASTPLPGTSATYDAADPDYGASTSGTSPITVSDATQTGVVAAPSPVPYGSPVTLTATVSPSGTAMTTAWPPGGAAPSGTVTFQEDGNPLGSATLSLSSAGVDTATLTVKGVMAGTHTFSASYAGNGSVDLLASTGSTSDIVGFTQTISGTYSAPLTVKSGQSVLITGTVSGPITVDPGGGLEVQGGSVSGPISVSGATGFALCGAVVSGPVSVNSSPGEVFIGGGSGTGCTQTSISGPLRLSGNTGGVEVANSTVSGPVSVSSNSGQTTVIAGNTIHGPLSCSGNTPGVSDSGQPNSAATRSGQCDVPKTF